MFIVYGAFCAGDGAAVSALWLAFVNDGNTRLAEPLGRLLARVHQYYDFTGRFSFSKITEGGAN